MFFSFLFLCVLLVGLNKLSRLLPILVNLEFLSLVFLASFLFFLKGLHQDSVVFLFFLVVIASESVLGLVLFVLFTRYWSKDYISVLISSKF